MALDKHSVSDDAIVSPGGWCAPSENIGDPWTGTEKSLSLPQVSVARGGIDYTDRRTEAEKAAGQAIQALILRKIGDIRKAQIAAIDIALLAALDGDYDVHIQYHPWRANRFVGISLEPGRRHIVPTLHEHPDDYYWEDD